MPAELHPAATHPPRLTRDPDTLAALRDLALECALGADPGEVREILVRRAARLDGASVLAVLTRLESAASGPLADLCARAGQDGRMCMAGADAALPAPDGLVRAVAAPMRVRGEPAALGLGWAGEDPGAERAWTLAEALAEQAGVALSAAARLVELRDAAFRRDRFFSAMSHDLRTPITAIVGYSELLQDGIVGELTDRQQEMVQRICQVSGELAQLVTDMLDLAKLDAGRMEFHRETVTLGAVLESGLEGAEPQLEATGSRLERGELRDVECPVEVDRPRIRQVVSSMVSHAAHAAPGGEVRVSAACDGGDLRVEVSDDGPALAAGCEEALFEALPRGALRETRAGPGAALSLALSRRIARAMGGELEARGLAEQGVTLTLRLPRGIG